MTSSPPSAGIGMMRLAARPDTDPAYFTRAIQEIRQLPGVLRVRLTDDDARELEIVYQQPARDLLRDVHYALSAARQQTVTSPL